MLYDKGNWENTGTVEPVLIISQLALQTQKCPVAVSLIPTRRSTFTAKNSARKSTCLFPAILVNFNISMHSFVRITCATSVKYLSKSVNWLGLLGLVETCRFQADADKVSHLNFQPRQDIFVTYVKLL